MAKTSNKPERKPLGYVQLKTGEKPVLALHDVFLNFLFEREENWDYLRKMVNIFVNDYTQVNPTTQLKPIIGEIEVETQYRFLLDKNKLRDQDIKIKGNDITYVEFQNRATTNPPIEVRASEYFGLGLGHSKEKLSNQIWLLADDCENVLLGNAYTNYIMVDELTSTTYFKSSNLTFVSLTKVAEGQTEAGELSAFLLGSKIIEEISYENVKHIAQGFNSGFNVFKMDKEAIEAMTFKDRALAEGKAEGRAEGRVEGRVEGEERKAREITVEMVMEGFNDDVIAKLVKMPVSWVRDIRESQKELVS